jgi:hypothetical protein
LPFAWSGTDVAIRVTLPNKGFLHYVYHRDEPSKTTTLTVETDEQRTGHFRVFVPGPVESVRWNGEAIQCAVALEPGFGSVVLLKRSFKNDRLQIKLGACRSAGLPERVCSPA